MRGIGNIIVGLVMVVGGLSGQLAFRGTGSSNVLALAGVGVLGFGVFQAVKSRQGNG